ncbi:TPA: hypothetical protein HJQ61_004132 [Escherichia coli]|nr:hypothetical protein [Escherichia coli]
MKMIFTGKVSGEKTVLAAGARHTVKAQAGEQYGLVDEVTGLVPDGVEADRSGDDLILRKKEDSTEVRIEGFWEECQPGETQCTAVFNVVGENGQVTEAVLTQDGPVLENFTAGQSGTLAGGINNGIIWGGIAFGAGLAAIALAAGGGGGSSRHKRTAEGEQKPLQPDGNGKADAEEAAFNNAKAHLEKALNTVYQPNDDLYAVYKSAFNKPTGNPEASTTSWREVLNQNGVSGFSVDKGHDAAYRYTYNGLDGDDVISTAYSVGGTGRSMVSRNDMVINTNGGDDIISVGMDYGRSYSAGYTDKKYATNTGAGDDIMMIGLGNNKVGVHLRDDLSLRIVDRDDTINNGELLLPVSQYDKGTGGIISSTSINMGDGNDTLLAFGYEGFGKAIVNTNIDLGAGNDIIHVNGDVEAVNIKGGEGMDTLAISHGTLSTTDFSGFEVIELGDNNGGINVIASALVHSGVDAIEGGILKITGTSNARVNLDGNDWKSGGVLSEDGVNYNVYTHDAAPDIKILIDEHITNVV